MKLGDPFRLNDWAIGDFLKVILTVQFVLFAVIGFNLLGYDIPILRQVVGFIYLAFIPGILLLRVFKIHNLGVIETVLYSSGLSLAFVMLIGLLMNTFYPFVGIAEPLSTLSLLLTISAAVLILCALSYASDKDFSNSHFFDFKSKVWVTAFVLCLLPVLSVFGTYFMNVFGSNTLLIVLLIIIPILPILAMFGVIPKQLYPLAIFVIGLSLLFHYSLISTYLTGWDIQSEFYFASVVQNNSYWTSSIPNNYNAMLSVVMVAPIFSNICDLGLVWVFKIFYPLLFSLVPLGLYKVFRGQTNEKVAFLSCFFFIAIFTFYTEMLAVARQQIAELFLVLLLLLMVEKSVNVGKRSALGFIFAFFLVTSHYGLSYLFMTSLIVVWAVLWFKKWQKTEKGLASSNTFVVLYLIFVFTWYVYISSASILDQGLRIGDNIATNLFDFLNPSTVEGLNVIVSQATTLSHQLTKYLYLMLDFSIFVGILALVLKRVKFPFKKEYALFAVVSFLMLIGGITLPYFASALNASRIYQIALIFLAPFCIIGAQEILNRIYRLGKPSSATKRTFLKGLAVFFAVFFLFDSGLLYQVTNSGPTSISLNTDLDFPIFNEQEILAGTWLKERGLRAIPAYSDNINGLLLLGLLGDAGFFYGDTEVTTIFPERVYFYLGGDTVMNGELGLLVQYPNPARTIYPIENLTFSDTLLESNKIYDNGGANIYYYSAG